MPRDAEHREQAALIRWAALHARRYPALRLLYAVPNGGHRVPAVAARMKAEGVRAGIPDLCLPVPRCGYSALYVEMKAARGRLTDAQAETLSTLRGEGNACAVCHAWTEAADLIAAYLTGDAARLDALLNREGGDARHNNYHAPLSGA